MKRLCALLLCAALAAGLAGCTPAAEQPPAEPTLSPSPTETLPASGTEPVSTQTPEPSPVVIQPEPEPLAFFRSLLREDYWYTAALSALYDSPADMDLALLFYNGFGLEDHLGWSDVDADEEVWLLDHGLVRNITLHKLPEERLEQVLNDYFGISLSDARIPDSWVYCAERRCFYANHGDAWLSTGVTVTAVEQSEDGRVRIHYYITHPEVPTDPKTGWPVVCGTLTLCADSGLLSDPENHFTVCSNQAAQPVDALMDEGLFLYALADGRLVLQDGWQVGPVTYVNEANEASPGCFELSAFSITGREEIYDWEGEYLYTTVVLSHPTADGGDSRAELIWSEDTAGWESAPVQLPGPLGQLMGEVTADTVPEDPKQFYRVANSGLFTLYARDHGEESLLTWNGNFWWYLGMRRAHTGQFNLPVMTEPTQESVAVISQVQSGTQTAVDELVVYQIHDELQEDGSTYLALEEYVYDWRSIAESFNRSNTIRYDRQSNSLTLFVNGEELFSTGTLVVDLSDGFDLEDGFTGALLADGQLVSIEPDAQKRGSFTVTLQTCIARGGSGSFSEELSDPYWIGDDNEENAFYPMSVGVTGIELRWTVTFTGSGFGCSDAAAALR